MRLRELLADPDLRLTLLDGEQSLDRPLTSVTTIDLLDPRRYLRTGALVLTGLMWHRGSADSAAFTDALVEFDVVALGAGEAALGSVPADLVRACHERGIAVFSVPVEVAFSQVSDRVAREQEAEREHGLAVVRDRQRRLLSAVAEGRGVAALLGLVADEVGSLCGVMTPTGREVAAGGLMTPTDLDALTRAFLVDPLPAVVATSAGSRTVLPVGSRLGQEVTSWFLVGHGDHREWSDDMLSAVDDLTAAVALERSRLEDGRRVERRIADEVVDLVAAGRATRPETAARINDLGVDPAGPFLVAVATFPDRPDLIGRARDVLHDAGLHLADLPVTGVHQDQVVALVPVAGVDDPVGKVRAALQRLEAGLRGTRLAVGVSGVVARDALAGALDEGRHAQRLAALRGGPVAVVTVDEVTSHVLLLAAVPDDVRRTFAARVLGPVLDHDERHGGNLVATLRAFLEANGSWSRCAEALHLHVNSVRYRISRVEALTGRDISRFEDRVDLFLALRSLPE
ncbi:MAG: PucR family transcriptional regulator [Jiangellaceae bacterium]